MKNVVVLGSTGSIGQQTLNVIEESFEDFCVLGLAAKGTRIELLIRQIIKYRPKFVVVYDNLSLNTIKNSTEIKNLNFNLEFETGMEGLVALAALPEADIVVNALVGMIGIEPTISAIVNGKRLALANKETLVCAGELIMNLAQKYSTPIIPIDSEHGAIFQCIQGIDIVDIQNIILTASGGPFRGKKVDDLKNVMPEQALKHPNWNMGMKISIDSATLVNKGLEMIELKWLYHLDSEQIIPIIHPQSIIHSMVELKDGSVLAQLSEIDMRLPIEVALMFPRRGKRIVKQLDFLTRTNLSFEKIEEDVFRAIPLARCALIVGGLMPAVYNAANEIAVEAFLKGKISFLEIYDCIEYSMMRYDKEVKGHMLYQIGDIKWIINEVVEWIKDKYCI